MKFSFPFPTDDHDDCTAEVEFSMGCAGTYEYPEELPEIDSLTFADSDGNELELSANDYARAEEVAHEKLAGAVQDEIAAAGDYAYECMKDREWEERRGE